MLISQKKSLEPEFLLVYLSKRELSILVMQDSPMLSFLLLDKMVGMTTLIQDSLLLSWMLVLMDMIQW